MIFRLLVRFWLALLPPVRASGQATVFWRSDGQSGQRLACSAEAKRILGDDRLRDDLPIVAMRGDVPCGGLIWIEYASVFIPAVVLERGPYGMTCADGQRRVGKDLKTDCSWSTLVDVTPHVAKRLNLPGSGNMRRGRVRLRWW